MIANRPQNPEAQVPTTTQVAATPDFFAFDSSTELWKDSFTITHSVPKPKVFLTNQI